MLAQWVQTCGLTEIEEEVQIAPRKKTGNKARANSEKDKHQNTDKNGDMNGNDNNHEDEEEQSWPSDVSDGDDDDSLKKETQALLESERELMQGCYTLRHAPGAERCRRSAARSDRYVGHCTRLRAENDLQVRIQDEGSAR
jgi:hypothetical protein